MKTLSYETEDRQKMECLNEIMKNVTATNLRMDISGLPRYLQMLIRKTRETYAKYLTNPEDKSYNIEHKLLLRMIAIEVSAVLDGTHAVLSRDNDEFAPYINNLMDKFNENMVFYHEQGGSEELLAFCEAAQRAIKILLHTADEKCDEFRPTSRS